MNDKKQIEEMEKFIIKTRNILKNILLVGSRPVKNTSKKDCYFCLMNLQELYKSNSSISDKDFLKILFEAKLPEDSVVLLRENIKVDKKTCIFCQRPLTNDSLYVCCDCVKKSPKELQETEIGKHLSQDAVGWAVLLGIFSGKMNN